METITSAHDLERALAADGAIIYKHSSRCGLSTLARRQIHRFAEKFPDADIFVVDVIAVPRVADLIVARLDVRHESPQVIMVETGKPTRRASHRDVRADVLAAWWTRRQPPA